MATTVRRRLTPFTVVGAAVAVFLAVLAIYPLFRVLLRLFWVDGRLEFSALSRLLAMSDLGPVIGATVIAVGGSSIAALVLGSVMAWLNERTDARIGVLGIAYWAQNRILRSGRGSVVSGKGMRRSLVRLGRWRWPARLVFVAYLLIATALPVGALALVSLNGYWSASIDLGELGFDALRRALVDDLSTRTAIGNSLVLGLVGATLGIVAAALVAVFVQRTGGRLGRSLDVAIKLPASIANIVIAVGFVLAFAGPPFRLSGTLTILLLAYLALYLPQASVAADAAAGQVGCELTEAARMGGAGGFRTFVRVSLPIMMPGLLSGWSLLFVRIVGDLTASSILAGTGNNVVGFRILEMAESGSFAVLAALSIALTVASSVVVVAVYLLARRQARWQQ